MAPGEARCGDVRFAVEAIGTTPRHWVGRGGAAFTTTEANKALEEVLQIKHIDYAALTSLNERAIQCVHDTLLMMTPAPVDRGDTVIAALTEDRLDDEVLRSALSD